MKNMQDFYTRLVSSDEALDRRLPALAGFTKVRIVATANGVPWFWWDAPQPIAAA